MIEWYKKVVFENYANFSGRAKRSEYWYFSLLNLIITLIAAVIDYVSGINFYPLPYGPFFVIVALATLLPSLAVSVRRLHDVGKSGWYYFITLIPIIGAIWILVLFCTKGEKGSNKYGSEPKNESEEISKTLVPMGQKIAFGLGMLANQMFPAALGIFMVVLVEDLKFPAWMWGMLFFLPRIFDAFIDPIMGFITDNTRSVWGRRRQYVFIGAIIMGISFVVMWQLYRENGIDYNFWFFLLWSFVFYIGLSVFSVPYVAMGYEMSDDFHERTSIMAISQWIGQWAWVIAPWFWVVMYDPTWFPNADTATRTLAVWVGISCMILAMIPAIFIRSKSTIDEESFSTLTFRTIGGSLKEIFESFKEAFVNKPFRKLCIATFLIFNAFNTVAGFTFFIVVYYLFNGNTSDAGIWPTLFGCVGALATTFIVIPIVALISKKTGKKNAFLICQGISVFGYILLWFLFIPGKPYMFLFALPFFSFGIGSLFTLMMSMTADVCDMDELTSGKRREGIFGAIYWWMVKFGFAIAGLLTGIIMSFVDFHPGAATQTEGAVTGLRLFFSGIPILGTLIAMWVMRNYNLTEEKAQEIKKELDARKGKL